MKISDVLNASVTPEQKMRLAREELRTTLVPFMSNAQRFAVATLMPGEEGLFFAEKMIELANIIKHMPVTYDTDAVEAEDKVAHLRYFGGGNMQWLIVEKDKSGDDSDGHAQAFGWADIGYGGEFGYISIPELIENNMELDFHFAPKPLKDCKR